MRAAGRRQRFLRGAKQVLGSLSLGIVAQALAFAIGILIVRTLDRSAYVSYSLSATIVGAVVIVADSGINSTLMAAAARSENRGRFRAVFAVALRWRRAVWGTAVLPALGLLLYLLLQTGVPVAMAIIVAVLTALQSYNSLSLGLASVDYQLSGRFRSLQGLEALNGSSRLLLVGMGVLLQIDNPVYYLLSSLLIGGLQMLVMVRSLNLRHAPASASSEDGRVFARAVRSSAFASVCLVAGEQLVNLILVQRDNALAIADLAALSRFALVFALVNVVVSNVFVPLIARAGSSRDEVVAAARRVVIGYGAICAAYVLAVVAAAPLLLVILGPRYDHLHEELVVVAIGAALTNFASSGVGAVLHARGWVAHSWTYALFLAAWTAYGLLVADVSTTVGAAWLVASLSVPLLLSNIVRFIGGFRKMAEPRNRIVRDGRAKGGTP